MSQEEKQAQRKAKAAEKKARADVAKAKKEAEAAGESQTTSSIQQNEFTPSTDNGDQYAVSH